MNFKDYIASVPNFPVEGVLFRDITPLLENGPAFNEAVNELAAYGKRRGAEVIVGPESRGFMFGCSMANKLNIGFVPVRKPGKLPRETVSYKYDLEYGSNEIHIHKDAIKPGQKVVICDDLLATGGTVEAAIKLIESLGGVVVGICFVIEIDEGLGGRKKLEGYDVYSLIQYD